MPLILRNPHSVLAALESRPNDVLDVTVPSKFSTDAWDRVVRLAREKGIRVQTHGSKTSKGPKGLSGGRGVSSPAEESTRMGGAEATVREKPSISVEELFKNGSTRSQGRGLWIALDSL